MRINELVDFIAERENVRLRKEAGAPKPWTKNPILQDFRFCNVHREDDKVTRWIAHNWRTPHQQNQDIWFWMAVARLVNWPDTIKEIGLYPSAWAGGKQFIKVLHARRDRGEKVFSGAYIVSTNGHTMDKAEYLAHHVLTPLWEARKLMRPTKDDSLNSFYERLLTFNGLGSFMAAQVVADCKYIPPLNKAPDWWGFAAAGPGSKRGLARVYDIPVDSAWHKGTWYSALCALEEQLNPELKQVGVGALHNQDIQNCLCEFDKYERVRLGEGRPRATYPGAV